MATSQKASSPKPTLPIRSAARSCPSRRISSASEVPSEVGKVVMRHAPRVRGPAREPAPDLLAVLVEAAAAAAGSPAGVAEKRDRVAHRGHRGLALADGDDRVEADLLGERDAAVDGVDRAARHPGGDDVVGTTPSSVRVAQPLDEQRPQLVAVGGAVLVAAEARVVGELGHAEHLAQLAELAVVAGGDDQVAVGAGQRLVREQARVALPIRCGTVPPATYALRLVDQPGQRRGQQVDLDVLAAAGLVPRVEGGEDADGGVQPGHHVEDRDAGAVRRAVRVAGEAHQPGDGLDHQVVPGEVAPAGPVPKPLIEA